MKYKLLEIKKVEIMSVVHIQYQDYGGVWVTVQTVDNEPVRVLDAMRSLKTSMPDRRVRAVDDAGRLVDFFG